MQAHTDFASIEVDIQGEGTDSGDAAGRKIIGGSCLTGGDTWVAGTEEQSQQGKDLAVCKDTGEQNSKSGPL